MRSMKVSLMILVFMISMAGSLYAQDYLRCYDIDESTVDLVRLNAFFGNPGDTVWAPIYVATDSSMAGFKMLITYDTTLLSPVMYDDPTKAGLIMYEITDRFLQTEEVTNDTTGLTYLDTITDFIPQISQNPFDSGAILATFNISFPEDSAMQATCPPGAGVIFRLAFLADPGMQQGDRARFEFHEVNEYYIDTTGEIPEQVFLDCRRTDLALAFNDGTVTSYPQTIANYFEVDTAYVEQLPVINSFTASPLSISLGGSSTLSWDVTNATSVSITDLGSVSAAGSQSVSPTTTTTYTLTATNATGSASRSVTVTVGGGSGNNVPVISLSPSTYAYTVEQGQTVSFTVNANDADGDVVTLSATTLPNNATFETKIGSGSVSQTFSFTPDVTQEPGNYPAVFSASDNQGGTSTPVTVNITVTGLLYDRLFTTSAEDQAPVGGIAGKEAVYLPINLVTSQTVYGIQFDFSYDYYLFDVDSVLVTTRTPDYVVYDNIGQTPGEIRVVTFGLANEPVLNDDNTTAVLYVVMAIDSAAAPGDYPVYIYDGWESVNPDPNYPSLPLVTDSGIFQVDNPGDVNLDKRINVADLVNVVAYIIGNFGLSNRQFDVANVTIDGVVDVFDLVAIVNNIFGIPFSPAPAQQYEGENATVSLAYNDIPNGSSDIMVVKSELPVEIAGVELEITYDPQTVAMENPQLTADAESMTLYYKDDKSGQMKVLLHFSDPYDTDKLIQTGLADLIEVPIIAKSDVTSGDKSQLRLTKALLSTASAQAVGVEGVDANLPSTFTLYQNYPNPFNPSTSIDFSLSTTSDVRLDIYNILGQRVDRLLNEKMPAGTHRIVWDATNNDGQRVATGIYLYKLQVNGDSRTKKMMFLK